MLHVRTNALFIKINKLYFPLLRESVSFCGQIEKIAHADLFFE